MRNKKHNSFTLFYTSIVRCNKDHLKNKVRQPTVDFKSEHLCDRESDFHDPINFNCAAFCKRELNNRTRRSTDKIGLTCQNTKMFENETPSRDVFETMWECASHAR